MTVPIDAESLREVFVYLFRYWIQKHIGEVPEKLALSPTDGLLLSQSFALYYNVAEVDNAILQEIKERISHPVFMIGPNIPPDCLGITRFSGSEVLPSPFDRIVSVICKHGDWLVAHKERGLANREVYLTEEYGTFSIWKTAKATRLLFRPNIGELYGYSVIVNKPNDFFFLKSKSCREEGTQTITGVFKRSTHKIESKTSVNFDLLCESGEVSLLLLRVTGAGYKVFPRKVPEGEAALF
jgi:hypothetical protein